MRVAGLQIMAVALAAISPPAFGQATPPAGFKLIEAPPPFTVPQPNSAGLPLTKVYTVPAGATMVFVTGMGAGGGGSLDGGEGAKIAATKEYNVIFGNTITVTLGAGGDCNINWATCNGGDTIANLPNALVYSAPGARGGGHGSSGGYAGGFAVNCRAGNDHACEGTSSPHFRGGKGGLAAGGGASDLGDGMQGGLAHSLDEKKYPPSIAGVGAGGGGGLQWRVTDPRYPGTNKGGVGGNGYLALEFYGP